MYSIDYTPYKLRDWLFIPLIQEIWDGLSSNHNAIHLLEQNQDKINWSELSGNSEEYLSKFFFVEKLLFSLLLTKYSIIVLYVIFISILREIVFNHIYFFNILKFQDTYYYFHITQYKHSLQIKKYY